MAEAPTPQLRKDPVNNRWVIFSPARAKRPSDFKSKSPASSSSSQPNQSCPFCIGHEHECAPEIFRFPPNTPDWKIRVIQNLYPALSRNPADPFPPNPPDSWGTMVGGFGFHDVVIESPLHSVQLFDLTPHEIGDVLMAHKNRTEQLVADASIKYVQLFKNHGASAGASMNHSHSQILGLPIVPPAVSGRVESMKEYFNQTGQCGICQVRTEDLLIDESTHFISVAPFASTFPFEIWIVPREHDPHFHHLCSEKAVDLGGVLKLTLRKIGVQLNNPPFNLMIQTSPVGLGETEWGCNHWFVQIVPQLGGVGGFELGSGCYINPVLPEDAAKVMREVDVPT